MQKLSPILADRRPRGVLELGRDRVDGPWSATPDLVDARIVEAPDGDATAALERVAQLDAERVPLDLVIDHCADEADTVTRAFEMLFGRMHPSGLYVMEGSLSFDTVMELMLATVTSPELVDRVEMTSGCLVLERGSRPPSPEPVSLRDITSDPFSVIARG
jgi:hypothetical protein